MTVRTTFHAQARAFERVGVDLTEETAQRIRSLIRRRLKWKRMDRPNDFHLSGRSRTGLLFVLCLVDGQWWRVVWSQPQNAIITVLPLVNRP
jgi:hypothetical protein